MKNKDLDKFLDNLEKEIISDARKVYGEKGYDRWLNPKFCRTMKNADSEAKLTGECGDTMQIFLLMEGEKVKDASYRTNGCASSSICGSFAAELAIGKRADEILDMTGDHILQNLDSFPEEEKHCAHLAVTTVKEAINNYMTKSGKREISRDSL